MPRNCGVRRSAARLRVASSHGEWNPEDCSRYRICAQSVVNVLLPQNRRLRSGPANHIGKNCLARSKETAIAGNVLAHDFRIGALAEISDCPQQEVRLVHAGKAKFRTKMRSWSERTSASCFTAELDEWLRAR